MLPKKELEAPDWVRCEDLHPFWLIKRDTKTDKHNCEIRVEVLTQCSILDFTDWQGNDTTKFPVEGHTFRIQLTFIVNHKLIKQGAEVVLRWVVRVRVRTRPPKSQKKRHDLSPINCTRERLTGKRMCFKSVVKECSH